MYVGQIILLAQQICMVEAVNLFTHTLKKRIECDTQILQIKNFEKLIDDKTRCFYAETLPNPYLKFPN